MDCNYGEDRRIKIANRLKSERKKKPYTPKEGKKKDIPQIGLTQSQLASELLVSKPLIIDWEKPHGKNKVPSPDQLIALCDFYKCDIGYLLCEYDSRYHETADIQDQIGLSETAIDVLRREKIISDAFNGAKNLLFEKLYNEGAIKQSDVPHRNNKDLTNKLLLIDSFITECNPISNAIDAIDDFRKEHEFIDHNIHIDAIRDAFNTIYDKNAPNHYFQWITFLKTVQPFFGNRDAEVVDDGGIDYADMIYEIWLGLIDEQEHDTESKYRYIISQTFEEIIDRLTNATG